MGNRYIVGTGLTPEHLTEAKSQLGLGDQDLNVVYFGNGSIALVRADQQYVNQLQRWFEDSEIFDSDTVAREHAERLVTGTAETVAPTGTDKGPVMGGTKTAAPGDEDEQQESTG